jgi:hypothetical protein
LRKAQPPAKSMTRAKTKPKRNGMNPPELERLDLRDLELVDFPVVIHALCDDLQGLV